MFYCIENRSKGGATREQQPKSGCSNLVSHITSSHPNYNELFETQPSKNQMSFYSLKKVNIFSWLDFILTNSLPVSNSVRKIPFLNT